MATERERVLLKEEIGDFIETVLREYEARTPLLPTDFGHTRWVWRLEFPFYYSPRTDAIVVPEHVVVLAWFLDKEKAKRALRWSLAHEFTHRLQRYRFGTVAFTRPVIGTSQRVAESRATILSGVTVAEVDELWKELIDRSLQYVEARR